MEFQTNLENQTVSQFSTTKSYVERFLAEHPGWRDLPNWKFQRQFRAWCIYKQYPMIDTETIRRCRQKIQNTEHKFEPSPEVKELKYKRAEIIKDWIGYL
jgi:hypothetical protein